MRKIVLLFVFSLFAVSMSAQTFGSSGLNVQGTFNQHTPIYNTWLRLGNSQNAVIKFEQTPEGLNQALKLTQQMLYKNELEMSRPYFYHSKRSSDIKDDDPEALHNSIQNGESKINQAWYAEDGSLLRLFLGRNSYEIMVSGAYKIR